MLRGLQKANLVVFLTLGALTGCDRTASSISSVEPEIRPAVNAYHLAKIPDADLQNPRIHRALLQLSEQACNRDAMGALGGELDVLGYRSDVARILVQFVDTCGPADGFLSAAANDLIATGDFMQAAALLTRLLGTNPLNPQYYFDRGQAYEGAQKYDAALADYMQAIALEPDRAVVTSNLFIRVAEIHAKAGRYCDAIGAIRMWTTASPDRADNPQAKAMIARYASKQTCPSSYASGHATFPRHSADTIRVHAKINGVQGTFIVDTGASYVSLTSSFARRAQVTVDHAQTIRLQSANGVSEAKLAQAHNIDLNGVTAADVPVTVSGKEGQVFGPGVDGLLGQSWLSRFETRFEANQWSISER